MRKFIIVMMLMLFGASAYAGDYCISSGTKAVAGGNVAISTEAGAKLCGVIITTNGVDNAVIEIWDNATAASGTALFNMTVVGADLRGGVLFPYPISSSNGLFLDFNTCTVCTVTVYYREN